MNNHEDIILVTGASATGKTFTVNFLKEKAALHNLPFEEEIISDAQSLYKVLQVDDVFQGLNHYHYWHDKNIRGHTHIKNKVQIPFMSTGNFLHDAMYYNLFFRLQKLPYTGKLWFVEWAGGINTNVKKDSSFRYSLSYERIGELLQRGILPSEWLYRVKAVIHLSTDMRTRRKLNKNRYIPTKKEIEQGTTSWLVSQETLQLTGKDDFKKIIPLFKNTNIPHIVKLQNEGTEKLQEKLRRIYLDILPFKSYNHKEKLKNRDIILIAGRSASGKKTIISKFLQTAANSNLQLPLRYISDLDSHLLKLREDDQKGGFRHYHSWCHINKQGHQHTYNEKETDYIITDNDLVNDIFGDFFTKINNLPRNRNIWIVEWTGGINTNTMNLPVSKNDYSFTKMIRMMNKGIYPNDWMNRIYAVFHPVIENTLRSNLDETHSIKYLKTIKQGIISPYKDDTALKLNGEDDFYSAEKLLLDAKVPNVYHIENDGGYFFDKDISYISQNTLFNRKIIAGL